MSEKSTTKKRGFDGNVVVEGADQGTKRNQEAWGGISTCKEVEAGTSKTHRTLT